MLPCYTGMDLIFFTNSPDIDNKLPYASMERINYRFEHTEKVTESEN